MPNKTEILSRLIESYDHSAQEYAGADTPERVTQFIAEQLDFFISQLPTGFPNQRVLDLGSGPGDASVYLKEKFGITPECVDISPAMLELCASKGLPIRQGDFSNLPDADESVTGVFMNFSFLHIPKSEIPEVLREINRVICYEGVLQVTLFEGQGEGFEKKTKYLHPRFFSYYQQTELRDIVGEQFEIIREARLENRQRNLLSITGKAS